MAGKNVIEFTLENFNQEVMSSETPVLVDFWAGWCGPCRTIAPIIEELADEYVGKIKAGKVDVDTQESLSASFKIMNIPTVLVFNKGEIVEKIVGAHSKNEYEKLISKYI